MSGVAGRRGGDRERRAAAMLLWHRELLLGIAILWHRDPLASQSFGIANYYLLRLLYINTVKRLNKVPRYGYDMLDVVGTSARAENVLRDPCSLQLSTALQDLNFKN